MLHESWISNCFKGVGINYTVFGSIVYNRARVCIQQNFLKVAVYVIIIDKSRVDRKTVASQMVVFPNT